MCGICGWVEPGGAVDAAPVAAMLARLGHRGPDGEGLWRDPRGTAVLGHRRLRVVDLDPRADQPMIDPGGAVITYNGEVYGFRGLRAEFEAGGERFATDGDTEVLLRLLVRGGVAALERCVGMFACAVWWPAEQRLLLVRDRLGIKPLYWARLGRGIGFASEMPALLAHPQVVRRVEPDGLARWLQLGYTAGTQTLLDGVERLVPGGWLELTAAGIRTGRWYDLVAEVAATPSLAPATAADVVATILTDAVQTRLVADVPLGCFLSSGVDSTSVVTAAVAAGGHPETLTVVADGGADELAGAQRTAAALGLRSHSERCRAEDLLAVVAGWAEIAGDPLADPSLLPTTLVSQAARRRWTVALSGDGGDELTGGYPRLRLMPRLEPWLAVPRRLRPRLPLGGRRWVTKLAAAAAAGDRWGAYQALQGVWPAADVAALTGRRELAAPWPAELLARLEPLPGWQRYRLLDALTFLPERVLAKVDRASMAHSLEVRVPLLDHRLAVPLLAAPPAIVAGKRVLRHAITRLGGPAPGRRKLGFEIPLGAWLRGPLAALVEDSIASVALADRGLDRAVLRRTWEEHSSGRVDHGERLLAIIVLDRWLARWIDGSP